MSDRHSRALDKLGASLGPLFDAEDFETAKRTLIESCRATRRVRAGKDPKTGAFLYNDVPDYTTRTVAAVKVLEWCAGKPIARSVSASFNAPSEPQSTGAFIGDLLKDAGSVRAMQDVLGKMIAAAERVQPVDVTAREGDDKATAGDALARHPESAP